MGKHAMPGTRSRRKRNLPRLFQILIQNYHPIQKQAGHQQILSPGQYLMTARLFADLQRMQQAERSALHGQTGDRSLVVIRGIDLSARYRDITGSTVLKGGGGTDCAVIADQRRAGFLREITNRRKSLIRRGQILRIWKRAYRFCRGQRSIRKIHSVDSLTSVFRIGSRKNFSFHSCSLL